MAKLNFEHQIENISILGYSEIYFMTNKSYFINMYV